MESTRLDVYLSKLYPDLTRNYIQGLIEDGFVFVNGSKKKSSYKLKDNDDVSVEFPEVEEYEVEPENIPLDILYEDKDVLVVNKPKGMVVHPAPGHFSGTLVNAILYHCDDLSGIGGVKRPGIVHRIDKDTTGSLIICKNDIAHNNIALQIKEHSLKRVYKGIVNGVVRDDFGVIDAPIGRSPKDRKKMAIVSDGRTAITHFKVLERFKDTTYMEFRLETGRTHQIRVHMSSKGHSLLGDEIYGPKKCKYNLNGQTLHAETLGFIHPVTKEYIEINAPLPNYFCHLLKILKLEKTA